MASALVAKSLRELGAEVRRICPPGGDPFAAVYPADPAWRCGIELAPLEKLAALLAETDVCIVGGEDYPGLEWHFDSAQLTRDHPELIVLDIRGYARGVAGGPAVDSLVQAATGLVFENSVDSPILMACPAPTYGAVLHGLVGVIAALVDRQSSTRGQVVHTSLQQGAAMFLLSYWMSCERPDKQWDAAVAVGTRTPVVRCADGEYLYIHSTGSNIPGGGGMSALRDALAAADGVGLEGASVFGNIDEIQRHAERFKRAELIERLRERGIACEEVLAPGECWDHEQVVANKAIVEECGHRYVKFPLRILPLTSISNAVPRTPRADAEYLNSPLSGIRILDFGQYVAGCYPSRILSDLGAEVHKIEAPAGEAMRRSTFRLILANNAGKDGLAVDLKSAEGREITGRLCASAQIVCHNFRAGVAPRLGLDPGSLQRVNPHLITLESSAYGSNGPKAAHPAFDPILFQYCGHGVRAGGQGNTPIWYRNFLIDYAAGAIGAIGLLAALFQQMTTGQGAEVQVDLLGTSLFLMSELVQGPDGSFSGGEPLNSERTGFHPAECIYATLDGHVAIAARDEAMAQRLAESLGLQLPAREAWGEEARQAIANRVAEYSSSQVSEIFAQANVWSVPCATDGWKAWCAAAAIASEPLIQFVDDPRYGRISMVAPGVSLSGRTTPDQALTAPSIGRDTVRLLKSVGYTEDAIRGFIGRGVIASSEPALSG
jgi:crotonobetainyl-CoA:carnitine CoA-transferase CaiB-like acyl-CoA transferase